MTHPTEPRNQRQRNDAPTSEKPDKPYEGFPMFAHPSGQWAKKVNKKLYYFGSWRVDPTGAAALERLNREYPFLKDGRTPPTIDVTSGCTMKQLCNDFLASKEAKLKADDLSPRTFLDYHRACERLIEHFGKERLVCDLRPEDFRQLRSKLAGQFGVVSLKNEINRMCGVFNHAFANNLIEKPVSVGQHFDRPSRKALRRDRNEGGEKLFERDEVLKILDAVNGQMKALVLLGLNCGFGNTDVASLPLAALDLENGWVNFPRPKTEIKRRIPLWPETVSALKEVIANRPETKEPTAKELVFLTGRGNPLVRVKLDLAKPDDATPIDALSQTFGKLLKQLGINGRRRIGFYTLRHCFETMAGESKDQVAVDAIMGHVDSSMSANYRHRISDERLRDVVNTVRTWLYGQQQEGGNK